MDEVKLEIKRLYKVICVSDVGTLYALSTDVFYFYNDDQNNY